MKTGEPGSLGQFTQWDRGIGLWFHQVQLSSFKLHHRTFRKRPAVLKIQPGKAHDYPSITHNGWTRIVNGLDSTPVAQLMKIVSELDSTIDR